MSKQNGAKPDDWICIKAFKSEGRQLNPGNVYVPPAEGMKAERLQQMIAARFIRRRSDVERVTRDVERNAYNNYIRPFAMAANQSQRAAAITRMRTEQARETLADIEKQLRADELRAAEDEQKFKDVPTIEEWLNIRDEPLLVDETSFYDIVETPS